MRYHKMTYPDVGNGIGCRVVLWVSGCIHHCKECHNPETWDFNGGIEFTEKSYQALKETLSLPYIRGLTLSGGDPMCSYEDTLKLAKRVKNEFPEKDIWLYTGYTLQQLIEMGLTEIFSYLDVIVDGLYDKKLRDTTLAFRGSKNQNIWIKDEYFNWVLSDKFDNP